MFASADETIRKLLTFGVIGVAGTGVHYLTLIVLVESIGIDPVAAATIGFSLGAAVNYALNYHFTFKSTKAHLATAPKFFLSAVATGLLNAVLVYIGVQWVVINYLLAQFVATLTVFLLSFAINSLWTFQEPDTT